MKANWYFQILVGKNDWIKNGYMAHWGRIKSQSRNEWENGGNPTVGVERSP